ncbi:unnamed protein product [Vitrella brassicaformis CCMP3155]|uniref:Uncharacterized protein n=2 Tax=Vitrella brassicaformis TaxID=1169539 RepID=A0A0G4FHL4_VITBC|nr:unnamed protein product [Vitrella brassicaformis CCMP3155]|eukprot:CEM13011.1 unnamed protein product [Vitrella brassicaformis CCMP3155]
MRVVKIGSRSQDFEFIKRYLAHRLDTLVHSVNPKTFIALVVESDPSPPAAESAAAADDLLPQLTSTIRNAIRRYADALADRNSSVSVLLLPYLPSGSSRTAMIKLIQSQIDNHRGFPHCLDVAAPSRSYCVYGGIDKEGILLSLSPALNIPSLHLYMTQAIDAKSTRDTASMEDGGSPALGGGAPSAVWCDELEVVSVDRLREAIRSYVRVQLQSLQGGSVHEFDIGRCAEDLRIIWAWSASQPEYPSFPSLLHSGRTVETRRELDTITHVYFQYLHDKCVSGSPYLFDRNGRASPKNVADFVNTIRTEVPPDRQPSFQQPRVADNNTLSEQKVSSYLAGLSGLLAFYHGDRPHSSGLYAHHDAPDLARVARRLDRMAGPAELPATDSSFDLPAMEMVVSPAHQLADKIRQCGSAGGGGDDDVMMDNNNAEDCISLRIDSDGLGGQIRSLDDNSPSTAKGLACRLTAPAVHSLHRLRPSLAPSSCRSSVGSLPMHAPGVLRMVGAPGLWDELIGMMPPAGPL